MSRTALVLAALAVLAGTAQARITEIRVDAVEPFAENAPFGEAGPYVRIRGVARGELDPNAAQNRVISTPLRSPCPRGQSSGKCSSTMHPVAAGRSRTEARCRPSSSTTQ